MQIGIRIDNKIPINPADASAYVGELGGIGGMVAATNALCKRFQSQRRNRDAQSR